MKVESYLKSSELTNIKHRIVSYGAGTQSTAMLLMGLTNKLHAKPDFAIFADTGGEPKEVYDYLNLIKDYVKKEFDFDIIIVKPKTSIIEDLLNPRISKKTGKRYLYGNPPLHINGGILLRECTFHYKIDPFNKYMKSKLKIEKKNKEQEKIVEIWMGISTDEMQRMKESTDWWSIKRYPLIEKELMRNDSIKYVEKFGLPTPPRSACTFCPYHSDNDWKRLKELFPDEFQKVVELEKKMQDRIKGKSAFKDTPYFHKSCKPISEVNFGEEQYGLFDEECDGICGI